jgi:hypothetical protein
VWGTTVILLLSPIVPLGIFSPYPVSLHICYVLHSACGETPGKHKNVIKLITLPCVSRRKRASGCSVLLPYSHNLLSWGWGAGGPWNSDSLHHLTRQWSDKVTTQTKLGNEYKSGIGRLRGEEKLRLVTVSPNISIIMRLIALPQRVIAKHNQTTMFSILLALQYQTSGSGARGDYTQQC